MAKSLADVVAETQAQVDGLRKVVEAKRKLVQEAREKETAEIQHLHDTITALREDLAKKRQYIAQWEQSYEAARRRGDSEAPTSTSRKIATAICSFPKDAKVAVDYGDTPAEEIEHLQVGYHALLS
jgi:flagellar biosynthesis/type III secretory pathway chaperone